MPLHPNDISDRKAAAISAISKLAKQLGRSPTQNEYKLKAADLSAPTLSQTLYLFSNWTTAIEAADIRPTVHKPPRTNDISDIDLITEFITIANSLQRLPAQSEFRKHSKYSTRPYTSRWQNWSGVKKYFADNFVDQFSFTPVQRRKRTKTTAHKILHFESPLCFQPTNEMETIVLFTLMAERLGFRIRGVRAEFPDAELEKDGETIFAEFEYVSSNYIQHGHDLNADCICICWRNDRELNSIQVIALEDVLREWQKDALKTN